MITVFTPTYNRGYILGRLYKSLLRQTSRDFEWIIVDDGSNDGTDCLVLGWIKENIINIRYFRQQNGGKHRAINRGVQEAHGDYFFIVDSDDYLTDNAIATVVRWFSELENNDRKYCGVAGERASIQNEKILGQACDGEFVDASALERDKFHIIGDKAEVFYTDVLKEYPFPEIAGETFVTENVVWYRIANDGFVMRWYNKPIYMCEYREDGLTKQGRTIFAKNPIGYAIAVREQCSFKKYGLKKKVLEAYYYCEDVRNTITVRNAVKLIQFPAFYVMGVYIQRFRVMIKNTLDTIKTELNGI